MAADLVAETAAETARLISDQGMEAYLASEEARWVTGTALVVDGGLTSGIAP
jgi:NAD(P)-dependent dehydrogenase (short-subunit alcohol dehydrogenase family)